MKKKNVFISQAGVIAAIYAVLTIGQGLIIPNSTSMAVQFRVSEVMCVLAFFMPAAIPGLTLGCVLSNFFNVGALPVDFIFGALATFIATYVMKLTKDIKIFNIPIIGLLMPAIANGLIIGLEIEIFFIEGPFNFMSFLIQGGLVALGEFGVLMILGIPFYLFLNRNKY